MKFVIYNLSQSYYNKQLNSPMGLFGSEALSKGLSSLMIEPALCTTSVSWGFRGVFFKAGLEAFYRVFFLTFFSSIFFSVSFQFITSLRGFSRLQRGVFCFFCFFLFFFPSLLVSLFLLHSARRASPSLSVPPRRR